MNKTNINESELYADVCQFFNEEDHSVGLWAVGKIDRNVIEEFQEAFEGVQIITYTDDDMLFKLDDSAYRIAIKHHHDNSEWVMYKLIIF